VHEIIFGVEVKVAGSRLGLHRGRVRGVLDPRSQYDAKSRNTESIGGKAMGYSLIECGTYIEIADTCFEGDDGSYRHGGMDWL
jgi:hypothetical protein